MNTSGPIGVFDSGVGGLSVLREIRQLLPNENVIYVADSGSGPYGERSADFIEGRARAIVRFLIARHAKAVVVACNTATSVAVAHLRAAYPLPVVAIEPAVKPAVASSRTGVVGVLATTATLASQKFRDLVDRHGRQARVLVQPCPGLAERVEAGDFASAETDTLVAGYVRPLIEQGADTIVIGCTHYTFLTPTIQRLVGASVSIVDPAPAVAREVRRCLDRHELMTSARGAASEEFWTSGSPEPVARVISLIWGAETTVQPLPRL
ncbi:MAG: glutamate racemase [Vicinamibacterales bacterium]